MDLECKQHFCAIKITETVREPKKKISAPQSKYCGGCRIIENAGLVSFALILSGMFRASQIEKLWKWIFCDMHVKRAF